MIGAIILQPGTDPTCAHATETGGAWAGDPCWVEIGRWKYQCPRCGQIERDGEIPKALTRKGRR